MSDEQFDKERRRGWRPAVKAFGQVTDAERLTWYQDQHTLHFSLQLLYCVDHYELSKVDESERVIWMTQGETLTQCIDAAMAAPETASEAKP